MLLGVRNNYDSYLHSPKYHRKTYTPLHIALFSHTGYLHNIPLYFSLI